MLESERVCVSDTSRAVREARASLFNLSSVNKTLRRLLFEESYRVISIHGEDGANKLVNLLRTLYNNPAISNSVEEFILHIEVEDNPKHISLNNMAYLSSPDLPRLFNFNEAGEDDQQTYLAELDRMYNQNPFVRSSKYILWAAGLVLSQLTRITDLTLSVSGHTLAHASAILLPFSCRFPSLESITLEDAKRSSSPASFADIEWDQFSRSPAETLARVARNVSDVFFQSWTDFRGFSFIMNEYGSNITSLIFDDITIDYGDLVDMIEGADNLEKFVCRKATVETDVAIPGDMMAPLLTALSQREATLRTIVITSLEKYDLGPTDFYPDRTFNDFSNLENLWLEGKFIEPAITLLYDEDGEQDVGNAVIGMLPASLNRLHVDNFREMELFWLAENCEDRYPNLKEVGFDTGHANKNHYSEWFEEVGVAVVEVDPHPHLW